MKRFLAAVIIAFIVLSLVSCQNSVGQLLSYQSRAAVLDTKITMSDGNTYLARMTLGEGVSKRDIKMAFSSPPQLDGVEVSRIAGNVKASVGSVLLSGNNLESLLDCASLFSLTDVELVGTSTEDGIKTLSLTDGVYNYKVIFNSESQYPNRIIRTASDGSCLTVDAEVVS